MKLRQIVVLLLFLFLSSSVGAAGKTVYDGTFLLRQRGVELDYQLKKQYLAQPSRRLALKNRENLLLNQSEVGFQVFNFVSGTYEYKAGDFVAEGEHCRVFLEKSAVKAWGGQMAEILGQIVKNFDGKVFPTVTGWFGTPVIPKEFYLEDDKIFIFLVDIQDQFSDGYVAGYFDHRDLDGLFGNQKPLFFMDINPGSPGNADDKSNPFFRTLAHEFQHMVSFSRRLSLGLPSQHRWLDEGFSMFSEFVFSGRVGETSRMLPPSPHYERFIESPSVNLFSSSNNSWFHEDLLFRQYGASFLFVTYLVEKYGGTTLAERQGFVRKIVDSSESGADGLDNFLRMNGSSLAEVFQNWSIACYTNDPALNQGKWHFSMIETDKSAQTPQLPLKPVRHYVSAQADSFVGGDGSMVPNSPYVEEFHGDSSLKVKFMFESGMTPALAMLHTDGSFMLKQLQAGTEKATALDLSLADMQRLFLVPVAVKTNFIANENLKYSFISESGNLLLYPVANPAFNDQFVIFLRSSQKSLVATPTLQISLNNLVDRPLFQPVDEERRIFAAHYRLPASGRGQAICYSGADSCSFSFSAIRANDASDAGNLGINLSFADGAESCAMIYQGAVDSSLLRLNFIAGPWDVTMSGKTSAMLVVPGSEHLAALSGLGMVMIDDRKICWYPVNFDGKSLHSTIYSSGRYVILQDQEKPVLERFEISDSSSGSFLEILAHDRISGIKADSVFLKIDDQLLLKPVQIGENLFRFNLSMLPGGNHKFEVQIEDHAGNSISETRPQVLAGPVALLDSSAYPNPGRGNIRFRFAFTGPIDVVSASIKIYDASGDLVDELGSISAGVDSVTADWSGCDKNGRQVANGVYLARSRIVSTSGTFKKMFKLVRLR
ncbi:MAG: FlgD immunoglobulin-like domain containing protein [Candidatus Riflebacteria bacterium]